MKIVNKGRGIHEREVPGIERLQSELPDTWRGYTNLELAIPGGGREIDLIMIIEDRILAIDLKDWKGRIESGDGAWKNNGRQIGETSPVEKIKRNARDFYNKLCAFLPTEAQRRKIPRLENPRVQGFVVLTGTQDRSGISPVEVDAVFTIDAFVKTIRNKQQRINTIGGVAPAFHSGELLAGDWQQILGHFLNVKTGAFRVSARQYGSYKASSDVHCYRHPLGLYSEYDVEDGQAKAVGLLRRWDFTKAEVRFQTEAARQEIAGRERAVLAWLSDRHASCESAFLQPRAEDADVGVEYWEVFDRRRRLKRLSDFVRSPQWQGSSVPHAELVRQVLAHVATLHSLGAAHLNIGAHSVWLEAPSTVRLSHLMAASLPEIRTLGERRYQFLSSCVLPEDAMGAPSTPSRRDVFLLGCVAHEILFGVPPASDASNEPPNWHETIDADRLYPETYAWFERALSWDPAVRFESAAAMLAVFNSATSTTRTSHSVISGLEAFRTMSSQRALLREFPEHQDIFDDPRIAIWKSADADEAVIVKLWKREGWGDQTKELPRILAFLEAAREQILEPVLGFARVKRAIWLGDAIVLVSKYEDGHRLDEVIRECKWPKLADRGAFCLKLVQVVTLAHERNIGHGDIKPENIVVGVDECGGYVPVLVDCLDFSPSDDGERTSPAYVPPTGGKFERDRFAVSKVAEEIMTSGEMSAQDAADLREVLANVRRGPPENGTLGPLRDALERMCHPAPYSDRKIAIVLSKDSAREFLSDEGKISFRKSKDGAVLFVRGAFEQLEFQIDGSGRPRKGRRQQLEQKRITERFEVSLPLTVKIADGAFEELSDLEDLLKDPALVNVVGAHSADAAHDHESTSDDASNGDNEAESDAEAEEQDDSEMSAPEVDIPDLWRRLISIESDLRVEGIALGDSAYRRGLGRHVIPFQLERGVLDFDRDDVVLVTRTETSARTTRLGTLDIGRSTSELLVVDSGRMWRAQDVIARDGQRLQFSSHYEQTSFSRRKNALERVLARASRVRGLVDIFDPRSGVEPSDSEHQVDQLALAERYGFNESQLRAFEKIVRTRPVGLLQGPPGTGKTRFIAALIHYSIINGLAKNVLLASQSHEAVNGAAEALLKLFERSQSPSLLRVGHEGDVSEMLQPFHVAQAEAMLRDRFRSRYAEKLEMVGESLGIPNELVRPLSHIETAIVPVADRVRQGLGDSDRDDALLQTLESMIRSLGLSMDDGGEIDEIFCRRLSHALAEEYGFENASAVGRFCDAALLGRDFMNSVSSSRRNFEAFLAGTRQVVVGTCVGLGRSSLGLTATPFDLVIVDEAARCTAGELLVPLQAGRWLVMVGDHKQLEPQYRPEVVSAVVAGSSVTSREVLKSDFERVFESGYGKRAGVTLTQQYRMLPPIGRLVSESFYPDGLTDGRQISTMPPDTLPPEFDAPLIWLATDRCGASAKQRQAGGRAGALDNLREAELIVSTLRLWDRHEPFHKWLERRDDRQSQAVGVICAYRAQADLIRGKIRASFLSDEMRAAIKVDTVDSYQGKENPIVILSLVRNNDDGAREAGRATIRPGFMARPNRINVAMSRAMDLLLIVGASERWAEDGPMGRVAAAFRKQMQGGHARMIDAEEFQAEHLDRKGSRKPKKEDRGEAEQARGNGP